MDLDTNTKGREGRAAAGVTLKGGGERRGGVGCQGEGKSVHVETRQGEWRQRDDWK